MIWADFATASLRNGFGAFHHQGFAKFADAAGWFSFDDIFASWIIGTTIKDTKSSALFGHFANAAEVAFYTGRASLLGRFIFFNIFAFWIV